MNSLFVFLALFFITPAIGQRDVDLNSCRVQISCDTDAGIRWGDSHTAQGRAGKRGPRGNRGPRGEIGVKGSKGEPCDCSTQLSMIEDRLDNLAPACPQTKFVFSSRDQTTDWIRVKEPIPEFSEATLCAWITPSSSRSAVTGAIFSYATSTRDNEFILFYPNESKFEIYAKAHAEHTTLPITTRTHICVAVSRTSGYAKIFRNGVLHQTLSFRDRSPIEGGGALIIGQEQDSFLGGFDSNQAFSGTIENPMMWFRTLGDREIISLYTDNCSCPKGYSIAFTPDQIQFEGKVKSLPVNGC